MIRIPKGLVVFFILVLLIAIFLFSGQLQNRLQEATTKAEILGKKKSVKMEMENVIVHVMDNSPYTLIFTSDKADISDYSFKELSLQNPDIRILKNKNPFLKLSAEKGFIEKDKGVTYLGNVIMKSEDPADESFARLLSGSAFFDFNQKKFTFADSPRAYFDTSMASANTISFKFDDGKKKP